MSYRIAQAAHLQDQARELEPGVDERRVRWVTFTGTREPTPAKVIQARHMVEDLPEGTVVITGGCIGIDAVVARAAKARGLYVHTIVPADRSRVDPQWKEHCDSYERMPPGTSYRDRDERMVKRGREVIAIPAYGKDDRRSRRSGTWMTVRIAMSYGRPVQVA